MRDLYRFLELDYPGDRITADIHHQSVGLGSQIEVGADIRELCDDLTGRLDACLAAQKKA